MTDGDSTSPAAPEDSLAEELSARLLAAHRRVRSLDLEPQDKERVVKRLLALTDASKHDVGRASRRLDALLEDLDEGVVRSPEG